MVLPTPFERLLQECMQLSQHDPQGAFARLDELYGKSLSEPELLQLSTFSVHLGAGGLGRFAETAALQRRMLGHPAVQAGSTTARSLWRALAVVCTLDDKHEQATDAASRGVTSRSEECKLLIGCAQMLMVRGRVGDAVMRLRQTTLLCRDLEPNDEVLVQVATVTGHLLRQTEPQARLAHELLLAAASAHSAALIRHPDWHFHHRAWFQHGHAYLLATKPSQALSCVQAMMELEDLHDAGPFERFHTASLACRAQAIRGQLKIAGGALEACQDFAKRIQEPEQAAVAAQALRDLEAFVDGARQA
jgi:hypothetical protein